MKRLAWGHVFIGMAALGITTEFGASEAFSAETTATPAAERCVEINRIRRTEVVDDENILFYMNNKKVFNNHLPQRCNQLSFGKAFRYETSLSRLCNVDIIKVVNSSTGEIIPGATCGLGMFEAVDPASKK